MLNHTEKLLLPHFTDFYQSLADIKQSLREKSNVTDYEVEKAVKTLLTSGKIEQKLGSKRFFRLRKLND